MKMVIYVDVLISFNTIVTYVLLVCTRVLCRFPTSKTGVLISSVFGGLSSLMIFLPELGFGLSFVCRAVVCSLITFIAFLPNSIRGFLKAAISFLGVSCLFGGGVYCLEIMLDTGNVVCKNNVAYLNIDIKCIVAGVFIIYGAFLLFDYFFRRNAIHGQIWDVEISYRNTIVVLKGYFDTGNNLTDGISGRSVIVAEMKAVSPLFTYEEISFILSGSVDEIPDSLYGEIRFLPCETVGEKALLPMISPQWVKVNGVLSKKISVAIVDKQLSEGEYNVLLNNNMME